MERTSFINEKTVEDQDIEARVNVSVYSSVLDTTVTTNCDDTVEDDEQWSHTARMKQLEEEFVEKMSYCCQRFSRPLRHGMITPQQHQTLFQNVEKVFNI